MCLVFVCGDDERVVSRQQAPGACPNCGGMIQALDVKRRWTFCFIPLYVKTKRRHCCTVCAKKLVVKQ
ncbi:uncharacterized protein LOC130727487 [Lotus japonicus]|uniref:uncharacterized protein LOC130727487 n=1 Tax=Lotus japonicus TaxID=34305 RepID=UPI00258AF80D|nr:uncharacterized protein LOC130727487 [Lotus japonicus]